VIDADGLAVAPGFINMMSWSNESLIEDGASQSDIRQGVTLEVMGEGWSMGPLTDEMKAEVERRGAGNPLVNYAVEWTTLGQYLGWLERRGISPNVASFVGASTGARPRGDGRGRARRRLGPDLSAGDLLDHA
jgi:N-acyl-D-amino-acid deacylase